MKISLFPFLPVLLCMMGAMIMFLVLAAWNIQESATHPNAGTMTLEEAEELQYKIEASLEESDWYAENFAATQQKAEEQLADLHAKLALAEKETQKIKEELLRLQALAQQLDSQTSATPEEVEQLKNLLDQQQKRLADAELELAELRKEVAQQEKSYAIVPRRSTNGTFRRPIYIECRDNKIIIQPEGIELLPGDFQALGDPANPFDTVLRTVRQYYIETEQIARGSEPYPLLLVRPSGIEMYDTALQAAQQAAGNWMNAFGYELVNEDWNIHYPEPNEELRNRMTQQLATARNRLNGYLLAQRMAEPGMRYGSAMPEQFRMDHRGNVMPVSQGPWREPGPSPTDNPGSGGDASVSQSQSPWREPGASLTDNPGSAGDATVSQSQSPWREPGGPPT
ncbi:MAG: hypothetical protein FWG73_09805, partial [Planctomycetaceae bacterium]|nr:hypothetical protein [Planctomycetaceae bacterium]